MRSSVNRDIISHANGIKFLQDRKLGAGFRLR